MKKSNYPVTFSIGLVTYKNLPETSGEIIQKADLLMYKVKKNKKNNIMFKEII